MTFTPAMFIPTHLIITSDGQKTVPVRVLTDGSHAAYTADEWGIKLDASKVEWSYDVASGAVRFKGEHTKARVRRLVEDGRVYCLRVVEPGQPEKLVEPSETGLAAALAEAHQLVYQGSRLREVHVFDPTITESVLATIHIERRIVSSCDHPEHRLAVPIPGEQRTFATCMTCGARVRRGAP